SRSYGPGRYDPVYEEGGQDYPFGYVRWTEGRNMQAFVDLLAQNKINLKPLIIHRYPIEDAPQAYELITGKTGELFLGVLMTYPQKTSTNPVRRLDFSQPGQPTGSIRLGVLGAGNYAQAVFLPIVQKTGGIESIGICTASGLTATHAAKKFGYQFASSTESDVLESGEINTVLLLTRHQQHARQSIRALQNNKHVYCEKPLALNAEELTAVESQLHQKNSPLLTVGFNRRFAPLAVQLKKYFEDQSEPLMINYRVNAGFLPSHHWLHDAQQGGGRIIGEGCHFIDFVIWMAGSLPTEVSAQALPDGGKYHQDNCLITLRFENGSMASVSYLANGNKNFAKERVEVFGAGKIGVLDDFRSLEMVSEGKRQMIHSRLKQDKGHQAAWQAFTKAITSGASAPIP
ncbi:MAG: alcohol dehydrogenase, partial [Chloroflexi bacterium HGW-Chloroflexi-7]